MKLFFIIFLFFSCSKSKNSTNLVVSSEDVSFSNLVNVNNQNKSNYLVEGTCSSDFDVNLNNLNFSISCENNTFKKVLDLVSLEDGDIIVKFKNKEIKIFKDTQEPTLSILNSEEERLEVLGNRIAVSGNCSENGRIVSFFIEDLKIGEVSCSSNNYEHTLDLSNQQYSKLWQIRIEHSDLLDNKTKLFKNIYKSGKIYDNSLGANNLYGLEIASSDKYLVVGAPSTSVGLGDSSNYNEAIFIYEKVNGKWELDQKVQVDPIELNVFHYSLGASVSISGERIAIGAPLSISEADFTYNFTQGACSGNIDVSQRVVCSYVASRRMGLVVVLKKENDQWVVEQKIQPNDLTDGNNFGRSVSLKGDTLVVGIPRYTNLNSNDGMVRIFKYSNSSWQKEIDLVDSTNSRVNLEFGRIVNYDQFLAVSARGKMTVFDSTFSELDSVSDLNENYATSISTSGNKFAVGHPTSNQVKIFELVNNVLSNEKVLQTSENVSKFGSSVKISENKVLVGANESFDDNNLVGKTFMYDYPSLTNEVIFQSEDKNGSEQFGQYVDMNSSEVFISSKYGKGNIATSGLVNLFLK